MPSLVEQAGDVVRVNVAQAEGDHAAALGGGRAIDAQAGDRRQALHRVGDDRLLVRADVGHAQVAQVVHGRAQPDGFGDGRGAGLELPGQVVPGGLAPGRRGGSCRRRP